MTDRGDPVGRGGSAASWGGGDNGDGGPTDPCDNRRCAGSPGTQHGIWIGGVRDAEVVGGCDRDGVLVGGVAAEPLQLARGQFCSRLARRPIGVGHSAVPRDGAAVVVGEIPRDHRPGRVLGVAFEADVGRRFRYVRLGPAPIDDLPALAGQGGARRSGSGAVVLDASGVVRAGRTAEFRVRGSCAAHRQDNRVGSSRGDVLLRPCLKEAVVPGDGGHAAEVGVLGEHAGEVLHLRDLPIGQVQPGPDCGSPQQAAHVGDTADVPARQVLVEL